MENEFVFEKDFCESNPSPINIHNVGVFFPKFFGKNIDYFQSIITEHDFQSLTESNKSSTAFRKGIYLTPVQQTNNGIAFNLLRCSSNLDGPTDNFRHTDNLIIDQVQSIASKFFTKPVNFNHVLAQTYLNSTDGVKQKKAKIKQHSDKTKDMPRNALMAFCSFYEGFNNDFKHINGVTPSDPFDFCYKGTSILTRLRFKLKDDAISKYPVLKRKFDITLYPNSLFIMSLMTNRLYTHEIVPSSLPVDKIPTRLGYVIRCSTTRALFKNGTTYILENDSEIPLEPPTEDGINKLKNLYYLENNTTEQINYNGFYFSLNHGDYTQPIV